MGIKFEFKHEDDEFASFSGPGLYPDPSSRTRTRSISMPDGTISFVPANGDEVCILTLETYPAGRFQELFSNVFVTTLDGTGMTMQHLGENVVSIDSDRVRLDLNTVMHDLPYEKKSKLLRPSGGRASVLVALPPRHGGVGGRGVVGGGPHAGRAGTGGVAPGVVLYPAGGTAGVDKATWLADSEARLARPWSAGIVLTMDRSPVRVMLDWADGRQESRHLGLNGAHFREWPGVPWRMRLYRQLTIIGSGSRRWTDQVGIFNELDSILRRMVEPAGEVVVKQGCAKGADRMFAEYAGASWMGEADLITSTVRVVDQVRGRDGVQFRVRNNPWKVADQEWWEKGLRAGHERNERMVASGADIAVVCPLEDSPGTRDCMKRLEAARVPVVNIGAGGGWEDEPLF